MITSTARYGVGRNQRIQLGRHREFLVKERKWCIPTLVHLRQRNWFLVYFTYHFFFFHPLAIDPQEVSLLTSQLLRWLTVNRYICSPLPIRSSLLVKVEVWWNYGTCTAQSFRDPLCVHRNTHVTKNRSYFNHKTKWPCWFLSFVWEAWYV